MVASAAINKTSSKFFTLPKFFSDHAPVAAEIEMSGSVKTRWKINNKIMAEKVNRNIRGELEIIKDRMMRELITPEEALFQCEDKARVILKAEGARIAKEKRKIINIINEKGEEEATMDVNLKETIQKIIDEDNEGIILRTKIKNFGIKSKGKASFKHLENDFTCDKNIKELYDIHGNLLSNPKEVEERANQFYGELFGCADCKVSKVRNGSTLARCKYCSKWQALGVPPTVNPNSLPKSKLINDEDNLELIQPISMVEIMNNINEYKKKNKSPGSSGLSYEFYKEFKNVLAPILEKVYSNARSVGHFPDFVSEGVITLIPKPRKDVKFIENYRPITLLNTLYKIYSSIINDRLSKHLEKIISNNQKGFMKGRRADDLVKSIQDAFDSDNSTAILMVDFRKAFDSLSHKYIFERLSKLGFHREFVNAIAVSMNKVKAKLEIGSGSTHFNLNRGAKQGDKLSCALFIIAMEDLFRKLNANGKIKSPIVGKRSLKSALYADDISILVAGSENTKKSSIDVILGILDDWTLD